MRSFFTGFLLFALIAGAVSLTQTDTFDDLTNGVPSRYDSYIGQRIRVTFQNEYVARGYLQSDGTLTYDRHTYSFNWDDVVTVFSY